MKISVFAVGRLKESYLRDAEAEYRKRLRAYCTFDVVEVRDEAALLAAVPDKAHLYALDERGDALTSEQFAKKVIQHEQLHGSGALLAFAIGGADGHSDAVRKRAVSTLSFGKLTIPHRLVRILLAEQVYRAFTILQGTPYHR